jgi:hypothetical protein
VVEGPVAIPDVPFREAPAWLRRLAYPADGGCWLWIGAVRAQGERRYPKAKTDVPRRLWTEIIGPLPSRRFAVVPSCGVDLCVRPGLQMLTTMAELSRAYAAGQRPDRLDVIEARGVLPPAPSRWRYQLRDGKWWAYNGVDDDQGPFATRREANSQMSGGWRPPRMRVSR